MTTGRIALTIGAIVGGMSLWSPAVAQTAQFPTVARSYVAWMARAMDECDPATISVFGPAQPGGGCLQANAATDDMMTMNFARLIVRARTGRILVLGRGFPFGARVKVEFTLRVTKLGQTVKHLPGPGLNKRVTFEDQVVRCPNTPFGFPVRPGGLLFGVTALSDCLAPYGNLARGNIEIIDSALVNVDTGRVFAHPGILR